MTERERLPVEEASELHSPARVYDYWLGGDRHSERDRQLSDQMNAAHQGVQLVIHAHEACMGRVSAFLRAQGIDQFLVIGFSIPVAKDQPMISGSGERVLFVEADPAEVPRTQARLEEYPNASAIHASLHEFGQILDNPQVREAIDVTRPLAVFFRAVLPYITDDQKAYAAVHAVRDALPSGSYLGFSHLTFENLPREAISQIEEIYAASFHPIHARGLAEVEPFLAGLEPVSPGIVAMPLWRPESDNDLLLDQPERSLGLVGIGYKP
jgi:hypothetical protein